MITLREKKQYLKERIEHYESLITMRPQNDLVSNFSDFIKEELFNSKRKLRKRDFHEDSGAMSDSRTSP